MRCAARCKRQHPCRMLRAASCTHTRTQFAAYELRSLQAACIPQSVIILNLPWLCAGLHVLGCRAVVQWRSHVGQSLHRVQRCRRPRRVRSSASQLHHVPHSAPLSLCWYPSAPASTPQSVRSCACARASVALFSVRAGAMPNGSCRRRQQLRCAKLHRADPWQPTQPQRSQSALWAARHVARGDGALSVCLSQY